MHMDFFVLSVIIAAGGELFDRIVERGHYTEKDASQVLRKLALALNDCHSNGILHRWVTVVLQRLEYTFTCTCSRRRYCFGQRCRLSLAGSLPCDLSATDGTASHQQMG